MINSYWDKLTGTHCINPPTDTQGSMTVHYEYNSARAEANVTKYDFDSTAEYVCFNGMKFVDDFDKTNVSATCQTGHDWLEPTSWGQCVDSK